MDIDGLSIDSGASIYYDDSFRRVLESYLQWLISDSGTYQINVDPHVAFVYTGDFFGLLYSYNIPAYMHWLTMRMNNLTSPLDFNGTINTIYIPNGTTVDYIRQSYMGSNRISTATGS